MAVDGKKARELNKQIRYTMWSVFRFRTDPATGVGLVPDADREAAAAEVEELFEQMAAKGVTIRGVYDVAGHRADADFMIW